MGQETLRSGISQRRLLGTAFCSKFPSFGNGDSGDQLRRSLPMCSHRRTDAYWQSHTAEWTCAGLDLLHAGRVLVRTVRLHPPQLVVWPLLRPSHAHQRPVRHVADCSRSTGSCAASRCLEEPRLLLSYTHAALSVGRGEPAFDNLQPTPVGQLQVRYAHSQHAAAACPCCCCPTPA